ncbi:hypothetical protein N7456_010074 [Penicillium angulare]|uniref:Myb-like domain-containing protein n=1 Tax=Penicillium angulare TaxID=116970 RepID=A0A9W9K5T2_9EURO|nr:hypothetical protein N7456_010074 [Penicillium angulare]
MSLRDEMTCSGEEMPTYYETIGPDWTEVETPAFHAAFMGMNGSFCTEPLVPPATLTPTSLPDNSFRPSPALSHRSQDYNPQEYQYSIGHSLPPQGLGIIAPFPNDFPRTSAPLSNSYNVYAPDDLHFPLGTTPSMSPQGPPPKRMKRTSSQSQTPSRDPINILPHPDGLEQIERERHTVRPPIILHPRPRAPGRGRRDPQAEEEDAFVEELRKQNTSWKDIRVQFREKYNKDATEARLQMRLKRRRGKPMTHWEENDIQHLITAYDQWEEEKYRFIADKIKELGGSKEYTPDQCKTQLRLIDLKQRHQYKGGASPSAMSDPPPSPTISKPTSMSRKRARSMSLEPE